MTNETETKKESGLAKAIYYFVYNTYVEHGDAEDEDGDRIADFILEEFSNALEMNNEDENVKLVVKAAIEFAKLEYDTDLRGCGLESEPDHVSFSNLKIAYDTLDFLRSIDIKG